VYKHVHVRLQALSGLEGATFPIQQALSYLGTGAHGTFQEVFEHLVRGTTTDPEQEPLIPFLTSQLASVSEEAWGGQYRPRDQAVHARLLGEYVRAAAERAAHQQPSLAEGLKAIMERS
jgi:hypothetical protein